MIAGFCLSGNLFHSHRFGQVNFKGEEWDQVSKSSKNFIRQLLAVNPEQRPSAATALQHNWLSKTSSPNRKSFKHKTLHATVTANMKQYKVTRLFKQQICQFITHVIDSKDNLERTKLIFA